MFDFWSEELSPDETERLLDKAAFEIKRRKLEAPAIVMLEMHRPLANVGANAAVVFSPFIVPFLGFDFMNDYSRLLSKPENVEQLLHRLEQKNLAPATGVSEDSCSTTTPGG